jgi:hypothetical protein
VLSHKHGDSIAAISQPRPTAPAVRNVEAAQSGRWQPGQTQRRWRIAEGNKAPREAGRFGLSSPLHSAVGEGEQK